MRLHFSLMALTLFLLGIFSGCTPQPRENSQEKPWCVIFYMEGGERDYFEQAYVNQAAAACWDSTAQGWQEKMAMTVLYHPSESWQTKPEWKGTHRYYAQDGKLVKDSTWDSEFISSDVNTLADYLGWARNRYPDHRYVFIPVGHGVGWYPISEPPYSTEHLRDTTLPWHPFITTAQIRDAIALSGGKIEMIYFNMCLMNQVESLAEWMDAARYIVATNNPTPDIGSDYGMLIETLLKEGDFEENMCEFLSWNFSLWKEFADGPFTPDVIMTDMEAFASVLPAWKAFTSEILNSLGDTVRCTDAPAVLGNTFEKGYLKAFEDSWKRYGFTFATDMRDYAYKALSHTGNMNLYPILRQLESALQEACVFRAQFEIGADMNPLSYTITMPLDLWKYEEHDSVYQALRFCRETGWDQWLEKGYRHFSPDAQENQLRILNGAPTGASCGAARGSDE